MIADLAWNLIHILNQIWNKRREEAFGCNNDPFLAQNGKLCKSTADKVIDISAKTVLLEDISLYQLCMVFLSKLPLDSMNWTN